MILKGLEWDLAGFQRGSTPFQRGIREQNCFQLARQLCGNKDGGPTRMAVECSSCSRANSSNKGWPLSRVGLSEESLKCVLGSYG